MIKFYKGNADKYIPETHGGGIYFAQDTTEIFSNGEKSFGKNADKSVITEAITIQDGPLASAAVKEAFKKVDPETNKVSYEVPANMSVQEVLYKLLCEEKWPSITRSSLASLGASVTAPTPQISATSKDGSLVEIGDTLTVAAMTAGNSSYTGTATTKYTGFSNGMSDSHNEEDPTNVTYKKNAQGAKLTELSASRSTPVANSGDTHSMSVTIDSGFTGASVTQPTANATASKVTCASFSGIAVAGANKVSVSETGVGYTASVPAIASVYIVSSFLRTNANKKFEGVAKADLSADGVTSNKNASVTGVYAIYSTGTLYNTFGSVNDTNAWNYQKSNPNNLKFTTVTDDGGNLVPQRMKLSEVVNNTSGSFYGYIGFGADSAENKKFVLVPTGWNITEVAIPDASVAGGWVSNPVNQKAIRIKGENEADAGYDFTNASGATSTYTKWLIKGSTAANLFKLTFSKN